MLFIRSLLSVFLLLTINTGVTTDWKLRREESGVKIFTRNVAGSPFEEFRGMVTISNTSLTRVLDVIMDVKNYPVNFPNCSGAEVLEQKGKYSDIHYITIPTPWPVTHRDAIYEANTTFSENGKRARIKLTPRGDYKQENKGYIRVYNGSGFWDLDEIAPGTIQVVYQFHADPAGEIPAWLANSVIVSNPLKTLESLRNIAMKI
ncbi:MAG: hypothetical protein NTZ69_10380 [Bacteroidia bacterium]|nr:hypothetical protein [Bacteroidia bacterium]